ncbi:MAG: hypothetical protein EOM84_02615, partial [Sphingobacteriia bacterium]|nr:hypothetical protein [Sphingobacteriia bacterium]
MNIKVKKRCIKILKKSYAPHLKNRRPTVEAVANQLASLSMTTPPTMNMTPRMRQKVSGSFQNR